ncbi:DUF6455 family protein [Aliiruegeria sabulilitoris]|uniref:DUF6455 family protein n=1 Tax=Aliiruegeria sabulilitoris TaxID=1510458 RepID=UPI0008321B33|nr:DUF6455 family protein [Aliiruegeria sabulilitoris]NDR59649.1 hypothetical protein [Pseudoruegeria sp. M32A2M]
MCYPGDTDFHFWLTRSVGRSIGLNFRQALDDGRLSADGYLSLVQACQVCEHVTSCQHWLGGQKGLPRQKRAPEFCRIGEKLDALKPH